ncbi:hypothetical protein BC833DRAFT_389161, partial [Globomyces pollinis-pini]
MFKFITCLLLAVPNVYSQGVTQDVIQAQSRGNQFTTGPCTQDAECQTGCCGNNLKCRNPQAFQSDAEFCQNGLTIDFAARNTGKGTFFIKSAKAPGGAGANAGNAGNANAGQQANNQGANAGAAATGNGTPVDTTNCAKDRKDSKTA